MTRCHCDICDEPPAPDCFCGHEEGEHEPFPNEDGERRCAVDGCDCGDFRAEERPTKQELDDMAAARQYDEWRDRQLEEGRRSRG